MGGYGYPWLHRLLERGTGLDFNEAQLAREFELELLLVFLADAGIRTRIDEGSRSEIPRLMAALFILIGKLVQILESPDGKVSPARPSDRALDRVEAVLALTL